MACENCTCGKKETLEELIAEETTNTQHTRFDLEQGILQCWNIVDDIKMIIEHFDDPDYNIRAMIKSLPDLYQARFQHTFECFEHLVKDKKIV